MGSYFSKYKNRVNSYIRKSGMLIDRVYLDKRGKMEQLKVSGSGFYGQEQVKVYISMELSVYYTAQGEIYSYGYQEISRDLFLRLLDVIEYGTFYDVKEAYDIMCWSIHRPIQMGTTKSFIYKGEFGRFYFNSYEDYELQWKNVLINPTIINEAAEPEEVEELYKYMSDRGLNLY